MERVKFIESVDEAQGKAKEAYEKLIYTGKITNMKRALLQDYATFDAFMGWYTSWARLVEIIGQRAATVYAHAVSTTNNFNSVLKIDVDQRLLPIVGEFKPATWRKDIK